MVNEEGNGLFARLRSAVNSRFSTWNAPAPIKEVQDISGDFNQVIILIECNAFKELKNSF